MRKSVQNVHSPLRCMAEISRQSILLENKLLARNASALLAVSGRGRYPSKRQHQFLHWVLQTFVAQPRVDTVKWQNWLLEWIHNYVMIWRYSANIEGLFCSFSVSWVLCWSVPKRVEICPDSVKCTNITLTPAETCLLSRLVVKSSQSKSKSSRHKSKSKSKSGIQCPNQCFW